MEKPKKLHPLVAVLVMAVLIYLFEYFISTAILYLALWGGTYQQYMEISPFVQLLYWLVYPAAAVLLCTKVIEKRQISIGVLLLIVIGVNFVCFVHVRILESIAAAYGENALIALFRVLSFVVPVVVASLMYLYVHIFDKPAVDEDPRDAKMQISLPEHILLLIFTCGIWFLVWVFRATAYLNCWKGEERRDPGSKVLLCMFVPFYSIYWTYKSARRIDALAESCGIGSDLTLLCTILECFIPLIPPILMQEKINRIIRSGAFSPAAKIEKDPWDF